MDHQTLTMYIKCSPSDLSFDNYLIFENYACFFCLRFSIGFHIFFFHVQIWFLVFLSFYMEKNKVIVKLICLSHVNHVGKNILFNN